MRSAGLRQFSMSELIKVAQLAVVERHQTQLEHGRLLRRWWRDLALVAGASFCVGLVVAWIALR